MEVRLVTLPPLACDACRPLLGSTPLGGIPLTQRAGTVRGLMGRPEQNASSGAAGAARFMTTRWSLVLAAGLSSGTEAREALSSLIEAYWYPLYAFIRRRGYPADQAYDLTQGFFARLLEKSDFATVDPKRGRFRSWLLASVTSRRSSSRDVVPDPLYRPKRDA